MIWKKLLLFRSGILELFVNTLTCDDKYYRHKSENFREHIQMQLSQEVETFSAFFIAFLKSTSNSEYFRKKDESHRLSISEIIDSERGGYLNF